VLFQSSVCEGTIDSMEGIPPKIGSLLKILAEWQAAQEIALGALLTAGWLADVRELERMFALPCEETSDPLGRPLLLSSGEGNEGENETPLGDRFTETYQQRDLFPGGRSAVGNSPE
jgi:hypothetical protein